MEDDQDIPHQDKVKDSGNLAVLSDSVLYFLSQFAKTLKQLNNQGNDITNFIQQITQK